MKHLKKEKHFYIRLAAVLSAAILIGVVFLLIRGRVGENVAVRAMEEIAKTASIDAEGIRHSLSLQFEMLETLASYLDDERSDPAETEDLLRSFTVANKLCTVGYTDREGEILLAVSADDIPPTGNISDRAYFQEAVYWTNARAVQYMASTEFTEDPRLLLAVPIVRNENVVGVVFASTEQDFFEEKILSASATPDASVFVIDASGRIIADASDSGLFQNGTNIFTEFLSEKNAAAMQAEIAISEGGAFSTEKPDRWFTAYVPVEVSDWYCVTILDEATAMRLYAGDADWILKTVYLLTGVFIFSIVVIFFCFEWLDRKKQRDAQVYRNATRKMNIFLEQGGNAWFEFDSRAMKLKTSEKLNELLGYELPEDWFSEIAGRKEANPEFDYRAVVEMYNDVISSLEYRELVSSIRLRGRGLRWFRISMSALPDEEAAFSGVFGVVNDVTEQYVDEHLKREERERLMDTVMAFIPMAVSGDLTQNTYTMLNSSEYVGNNVPWKGTYDDLFAVFGAHVPEEYRQAFDDCFSRENLLKAQADGAAYVELEHPVVRKTDDSQVWILSKAYFLVNPSNNDISAVIVALDITEQKNYELLIQRQFDLTIENMPGYVCKWYFDGEDILLADANQAFYSFMRAPEEEVRDRCVIFGFSEAEKRDVISRFYALAENRESIHYIGHGQKYDGETFYMTVSGSYYGDQDGKPVYFCVISDITALHRMHEKTRLDAEELRIAAELSRLLVLKYDVADRKVHVLSNGTPYGKVALMDGHAPEYALETGIVPIVAGTSFYSAMHAVEQGVEKGEIRFIAGNADATHWLAGRFRTVFDRNGAPVSAILLLQDDAETSVAETSRMLADFYRESDRRKKKMLVANLSRNTIEFETESETLFLTGDGVFSYSAAKEKAVLEEVIPKDDLASWEMFMDTDRLIARFRSGQTEDTMTFSMNTSYAADRSIRVDVLLQESRYDRSIRAFFTFRDITETEDSLLPSQQEKPAEKAKSVEIRAFGYFDVFVDGRPVAFTHEKSKEMLAVLVDRRGGFISTSEMIGYLWEDESAYTTTQARCRQVASRLKKTLEDHGIGDIIETVNGRRRLIPEKVSCDYFRYLEDKAENQQLFTGAYLSNYSWSEMTLAELENYEDDSID